MSVKSLPHIRRGGHAPAAAALSLFAFAILLTVVAVPDARATRTIRSAFFAAYPEAIGTRLDTLPGNAQHCGVCHYNFNGGGQRNPYGVRVGSTPHRNAAEIRALGALDSDLDGSDNDTEILDPDALFDNTPTFPGLTIDNVGQTRNIPLDQIIGFLTPSSPCDPCDMNCDGQINAFDIEPFLDLLFGGGDPCDTCTGDANGDDSIDAFDIEPFLACLFP